VPLPPSLPLLPSLPFPLSFPTKYPQNTYNNPHSPYNKFPNLIGKFKAIKQNHMERGREDSLEVGRKLRAPQSRSSALWGREGRKSSGGITVREMGGSCTGVGPILCRSRIGCGCDYL